MRGLRHGRPRLGQHQPRHPRVHRVLGRPQEPRQPHLQGALPDPGRVESAQHPDPGEHREHQGQRVLGAQHEGGGQARAQLIPGDQSQLHQVKILPEIILHIRLRGPGRGEYRSAHLNIFWNLFSTWRMSESDLLL